jgi:hypothetical protein
MRRRVYRRSGPKLKNPTGTSGIQFQDGLTHAAKQNLVGHRHHVTAHDGREPRPIVRRARTHLQRSPSGQLPSSVSTAPVPSFCMMPTQVNVTSTIRPVQRRDSSPLRPSRFPTPSSRLKRESQTVPTFRSNETRRRRPQNPTGQDPGSEATRYDQLFRTRSIGTVRR